MHAFQPSLRCCCTVVSCLMAQPAAGAIADATCTVQAGSGLNPVPEGLLGTNVEWFFQGDGLADGQGNLNTSLILTAANQQISSIRFPGGTLSDFYHWQNGVGPVSQRPVMAHGSDPGSEVDVYGTPELLKTCQLT